MAFIHVKAFPAIGKLAKVALEEDGFTVEHKARL
jgi:hypothetical protein